MLNDTWVELESAGRQSVAATRVAAVENRHVVFLGQFVDGIEKAEEILFRVDVFLPVGGEQNVLSLGQSQPLVDVGSLDGV